MGQNCTQYAENSINEHGGLEEERRLMYVAMTRAMRRLYLSHSQMRMLHGQTRYNIESRFIDEIPDNLLKKINDGKLSINKAYQMVRNEHILPNKMGMNSKATKSEFKRRFQKLLNEFEPNHSDVMSIVNSNGSSRSIHIMIKE